jgi:proline racemase
LDVAWGGNFYAMLPAASLGMQLDRDNRDDLIAIGRKLTMAVDEQIAPVHPVDSRLRGCKHVVVYEPGTSGADAKSATLIDPGWIDRSPCGTGTSARLAQLYARGELEIGADFVHESFIGSRFTARILEETTVGRTVAVVPQVTGRAWITGLNQIMLDPDDPFPAGFRV